MLSLQVSVNLRIGAVGSVLSHPVGVILGPREMLSLYI